MLSPQLGRFSLLLSLSALLLSPSGETAESSLCHRALEQVCASSNPTNTKVSVIRAQLRSFQNSASGAISLYSPQRIQKARALLDTIKTIALQVIHERYPQPQWKTSLEAAVRAAEIETRFANPSEAAGAFGFLPRTTPEKKIVLQGAILLADSAPESLLFVLAHEMGHVVGPTYHFHQHFNKNQIPDIRPYEHSYPFDSGLRCVSDKVLQFDLSCYERKASELSKSVLFRDRGEQLSRIIPLLQRNPYVSLALFSSGKVDCQSSQSEESFADLFAAEILSRLLSKTSSPEKVVSSYFGFFCDWYRMEGPASLNRGPYPSMRTRIQDIIFSNETLRETLGCEGSRRESGCRL